MQRKSPHRCGQSCQQTWQWLSQAKCRRLTSVFLFFAQTDASRPEQPEGGKPGTRGAYQHMRSHSAPSCSEDQFSRLLVFVLARDHRTWTLIQTLHPLYSYTSVHAYSSDLCTLRKVQCYQNRLLIFILAHFLIKTAKPQMHSTHVEKKIYSSFLNMIQPRRLPEVQHSKRAVRGQCLW